MNQFSVGDKVRRRTLEPGYATEIGEIIEIDSHVLRARVKWTNNRTYYKLANLLHA